MSDDAAEPESGISETGKSGCFLLYAHAPRQLDMFRVEGTRYLPNVSDTKYRTELVQNRLHTMCSCRTCILLFERHKGSETECM